MSAHGDAVRAVFEALESGLMVHAEHPNFGGVVTAGRYVRAVGPAGFALIHHAANATADVTDEDISSVPELARAFIFQVGNRAAYAGACKALGVQP